MCGTGRTSGRANHHHHHHHTTTTTTITIIIIIISSSSSSSSSSSVVCADHMWQLCHFVLPSSFPFMCCYLPPCPASVHHHGRPAAGEYVGFILSPFGFDLIMYVCALFKCTTGAKGLPCILEGLFLYRWLSCSMAAAQCVVYVTSTTSYSFAWCDSIGL